MFNEILSALHDFAEGRTTKGGFTRLELILVRIRRDTRFNALKFDEILAKLVQKDDAGNEDFAMGISLAAKKTGCYGNDLRDAIERRLFSQSNVLSARSQYELSKLLIKCDGEFGPRQLNKLDDLKTEIPELWLDLALEAYPHDPQGLLDEINARLLDKMRPFQWESLKPRYLKLVEAVPNNRFDDFVMKLAENLPSEESKEFLKWVDRWRGTKLSSYKRNELPRGYKGKFVDDEAQAFVEENQSLEPDW